MVVLTQFGVTPVPIPNTEVKPNLVDGTCRFRGWESRLVPPLITKLVHSHFLRSKLQETYDLFYGGYNYFLI